MRVILTAGGIDSTFALSAHNKLMKFLSGITTMIDSGTGPATGTNATTCTPGPFNLEMMMRATEGQPMNFAFWGKGNASMREPLVEQIGAEPAVSSCMKISTTPQAMTRVCQSRKRQMYKSPFIRTLSTRVVSLRRR